MDTAQKRVAADRSRIAHQEYEIGLAFFQKKQWKIAVSHFGEADRKSRRDDENYHLYTSCHGLALVYCGDVSGLNFCRHAAAAERIKATVHQNLAHAELYLNHRQRACNAVKAGLKIDSRHSGLLETRVKKWEFVDVHAYPFSSATIRLTNGWVGILITGIEKLFGRYVRIVSLVPQRKGPARAFFVDAAAALATMLQARVEKTG